MHQISFTTPPNWPDPPAGFLPNRDWRPDPAWGPAPAGFQFYSDPFGYPTPPPPELWQPWTSTDWATAGAMPVARTFDDASVAGPVVVNPAPVVRRRRWLPWVAGLLALALLATAGWFGWRHWRRPLPEPKAVTTLKPLYEPALRIGTTGYQFAQALPQVTPFEGKDACIATANAAVKPAAEAVAAGTDRGWTAVSWRYADAAAAQKAWQGLTSAIDGCTTDKYLLKNPTHSPDAGRRWVQYDQVSADGTDHGRVVVTTDANTLTYLEGGRTDMGEVTFTALRKRLATMS